MPHRSKIVDPHNSLADCTQPATPPYVEALRHWLSVHVGERPGPVCEPIITPLRHALIGVGLPLRILDAEMGPAQFEISLDPMESVGAADAVIMLRGAVKQVCRRMGLLASFMSKPALPNVYSSGWHLHQSLFHTATGKNAFAELTSCCRKTGRHFVGGLLEHAHASAAFSNPTVNGYRRLMGISWRPGGWFGRTTTRVRCAGWSAAWAIRRRISRTGPASRQPTRISTWARRSSPAWTEWEPD